MQNLRRNLFVAVLLFAAAFLAAPGSLTAQGAKSAATAAAAAAGKQIDINTASPDQLKAIPGIGDAYSKRIIDGRPYTAKNQLVSRGILPQGVYDKVKDQIVATKPKK